MFILKVLLILGQILNLSTSFKLNLPDLNLHSLNIMTLSMQNEHFDAIKFIDQNDSAYDLSFTIFGDPIPLKRHRVARGIMFNPSQKEQKIFLQKSTDSINISPLTGQLIFLFIYLFIYLLTFTI
jgi:hypothetical protein